jgi:predicted nucleotidyltransferase component of viral defense system
MRVLLKQHNYLFAGGTAIALRYGEYRESVDIDFLASDLASYRYLTIQSISRVFKY